MYQAPMGPDRSFPEHALKINSISGTILSLIRHYGFDENGIAVVNISHPKAPCLAIWRFPDGKLEVQLDEDINSFRINPPYNLNFLPRQFDELAQILADTSRFLGGKSAAEIKRDSAQLHASFLAEAPEAKPPTLPALPK